VKEQPGSLTPFIRSDAVGAILAETLGTPGRESSLTDLATATGVSLPVVHREVGRLVDADVLTERRVGRSRLVAANEAHPLFSLMRDLVDATYGPVPILRELFDGVSGVDGVFIYGSWAARRSGEPGPYPNDLDVLAVGRPSRRVLADIAATAGERLGLPVNVTRLSAEEWEADEPTPFVQTVRERPLIRVLPVDASDSSSRRDSVGGVNA